MDAVAVVLSGVAAVASVASLVVLLRRGRERARLLRRLEEREVERDG